MYQLEEAIEVLTGHAAPVLETETVSLMEAVGRVLAEDRQAKADQPPFSRSPLDGYAVRGADTAGASGENPRCLRVIGAVFAGGVFEGAVGPGEAVRITTGAPIPAGADAVVRQEDSDCGSDRGLELTKIYKETRAYENYCFQGEDYRAGDVLLKKGTLLTGSCIALLASLGESCAPVYRRPRIAVLTSGDEVLQPGESMQPGKIYDSNLYFLCGRLKELGLKPASAGHVGDDAAAMAEQIRRTIPGADLVITAGGVSVGAKDIMHETMRLLGAQVLFWRVQVRPGTPTLAALFQGKLIICLSGNPFAAATNFELLVRPVLAVLTGNARMAMAVQTARLQNEYRKKAGVRRFLRGHAEGDRVWVAEGNHSSGALSSLPGCNCLIEILPEAAGAGLGAEVKIHLL
ncbi:MAG: molybdopterin molybdotransferase MoeA [Eubacteriales bacterium]|nr:molybdopterin molybdotransferase MoeA [Eubacteriales bacterium]